MLGNHLYLDCAGNCCISFSIQNKADGSYLEIRLLFFPSLVEYTVVLSTIMVINDHIPLAFQKLN